MSLKYPSIFIHLEERRQNLTGFKACVPLSSCAVNALTVRHLIGLD